QQKVKKQSFEIAQKKKAFQPSVSMVRLKISIVSHLQRLLVGCRSSVALINSHPERISLANNL
ncbi:MAG TPA: hypothetical protein DCM08_13065, partial [Microscillaceae bacterium]|nr:hypothetical protein [Microscillaceae bacterium]